MPRVHNVNSIFDGGLCFMIFNVASNERLRSEKFCLLNEFRARAAAKSDLFYLEVARVHKTDAIGVEDFFDVAGKI